MVSNCKEGEKICLGPERRERFRLCLMSKIIADVALAGVSNARKSTFLASVTNAKSKIHLVCIPGTEYGTNRNNYNKNIGGKRTRGSKDTAQRGAMT